MKRISLMMFLSALISGCNSDAPEAEIKEYQVSSYGLDFFEDTRWIYLSQGVVSTQEENSTSFEKRTLEFSHSESGNFSPSRFFNMSPPLHPQLVFHTYEGTVFQSGSSDQQVAVRYASLPEANLFVKAEILKNGEVYLTVATLEFPGSARLDESQDSYWIRQELERAFLNEDKFCPPSNYTWGRSMFCETVLIGTDGLSNLTVSLDAVDAAAGGYPYWDSVPDSNVSPLPESEWWSVKNVQINVAYRSNDFSGDLSAEEARVYTRGLAVQLRPAWIEYPQRSYSDVDWEQRYHVLYEWINAVPRPGADLWMTTSHVSGDGSEMDHFQRHLVGFSKEDAKVSFSGTEIQLPEGDCQGGHLATDGTYTWFYRKGLKFQARVFSPDGQVQEYLLWDEAKRDPDATLGETCAFGGDDSRIGVAFTTEGHEGPEEHEDTAFIVESHLHYLEWSKESLNQGPIIQSEIGSLRDDEISNLLEEEDE